MAKWMWIIAGPNGAGKTTFTNKILAAHGQGLVTLYADDRTLALRAADPTTPLEFAAAQGAMADVMTNKEHAHWRHLRPPTEMISPATRGRRKIGVGPHSRF